MTERIESHLAQAESLLASFDWQADLGLLDPSDLPSLEASLIGEVTSHPRVTEVTFTYGHAIGRYEANDGPHDAGDLKMAPDQSGQVSVSRVGAESDTGIVVRRAWQEKGRWLATERRLPYETTPHSATPQTHILSNGDYAVMLTSAGSGYSRWGDIGVTRWREDVTRDDSGS